MTQCGATLDEWHANVRDSGVDELLKAITPDNYAEISPSKWSPRTGLLLAMRSIECAEHR